MSSLLQTTRNLVSGHRKSKSIEHNDDGKLGPEKLASSQPEPSSNSESLLITQTTPAWHVHGSSLTSHPDNGNDSNSKRVGRSSMDTGVHPGTDARTYDAPQELSAVAVAQSIPDRDSSLRTKARHSTRHHKRSDPRPDLGRIESESTHIESFDEMGSSSDTQEDNLSKKPVPTSAEQDALSGQIQELSLQYERNHQQHQFPRSTRTTDTTMTKGFVNDDHQHTNHAQIPQQRKSSIKRKAVGQNMEHLKLPQGFQLQDSEHTVVETVVRPAVTREVIHHDVKEIRQEVITRDIHVHHYYTYVQPIKVVEILPAKHYMLDGVTGEKIEIPAPEGWQMPTSMQPHVPDTSTIKASSRHYLVNEQHPNGLSEPAPEGFLAGTTAVLPNSS